MSEEKRYYNLTDQQIQEEFSVDASQGLSSAEAKSRLEKYGPNEIHEGERRSIFQKFLDQFKDLMIIVLIVAAFVSWGASGDIVDAIVILAVVVLNAVLGVYQEQQAEDAIDALQDMSSPEATVLRDGQQKRVDSREIVPGDVVILEAGDVVPADMYIVEENSLQIEEAALTGESVPVNKETGVISGEAGIGDRHNMGFSSTNVTYGRGVGVVTTTGMDTEVGHIAAMLDAAESQKTPLQEDQDQLAKILTVLIIIIAIINFVVGVWFQGIDWVDMLLIAVSLAVAAIPEGLPAITTIILSIGTQNMAERNALVRSLPAVETLGSTQIIASDKTGTLTQNKMTVEKVYYNGEVKDADEPLDNSASLFYSFTFANDTNIGEGNELTGDPTETAMVQYGLDQGFNVQAEVAQKPRVAEVPFDSDRKLMSTIHELEDGRFVVYSKGAPDQLLERCTHIERDGQVVPMTEDDKEEILRINESFAREALRVLAGASKIIDQIPADVNSDTVENDLVFSGLMGMIDPERPEARQSIEEARNAGVRTIMITGDHAITAQAIAERLTILDPNDPDNERHVVTGAQLNQMSDEELAQKVADFSVYARVSPEHKVRIIRAWQANGKVISMTGDGVNDAPSLKQASIGVGMGITGTEVSKGASDMVLADDNFATIVAAIEEGRKVFANIQKAVQFLLSANLGEVLTLSIATFMGWQILEPIHILWINLVTDVFPAIALGMEDAEPDIMEYAPRDSDSSFFSNGVGLSIIYQGILESAITLAVYWYAETNLVPQLTGVDDAHLLAETMAFATLGMIQLFHAYNVKSVFKSLFSQNPFNNKYLNIAVIVSGIMLVGVIIIPGINDLFDVIPPTWGQWGIIVGAAFSIIIIVEIIKAILRAFNIEERFRKKTAE